MIQEAKYRRGILPATEVELEDKMICQYCKNHKNRPSYCKEHEMYVGRKESCMSWKK